MADVLTYGALGWLVGKLDTDDDLYGHWGEGTTSAARTDTALGDPGGESRQHATLTKETISKTDDTLVVSFTMTCNATGKTISEAGAFSASSGGTLLLRSTFSGIPIESAETIAFVFKWTML
jgi:hypothetical protein